MSVTSAGLLLFRRAGGLQVLAGHMGGPFWSAKDDHAWSIPKGIYGEDEEPLAAARREFSEELGCPAPDGPYLELGDVRQSGKIITAWAVEGDLDESAIVSNTFELEWPPRSGRRVEFPEIDRAAWFDLDTAATKLVKAQVPLLDRLVAAIPLP